MPIVSTTAILPPLRVGGRSLGTCYLITWVTYTRELGFLVRRTEVSEYVRSPEPKFMNVKKCKQPVIQSSSNRSNQVINNLSIQSS